MKNATEKKITVLARKKSHRKKAIGKKSQFMATDNKVTGKKSQKKNHNFIL